jgi:hypothetical protein
MQAVSVNHPRRHRSYREWVHMARSLACSAGALAVLIAVSACGSSGPKKSPSSPTSQAGSGSSGSSSSAPSPSSSPSSPAAKHVTKLHGGCDSLLPRPEVEQTLGVTFSGRSAFVVGVPEKNIGRLAYLNCRYGLPASAGSKGAPSVEVGISLYDTPAQAQKRLTGTIADYRDHGATQSSTTVSGIDATLLVGTARGYDIPLLVLATDQRTVAVSVVEKLLPTAKREPAMVKLAALALDRTAP